MRRAAVVLLACLGTWLSNSVSMSSGRVVGPQPQGAFSDALSVRGVGTVTFSAVVHPHGRATTAFFEFGLASRYREPRPSGVVYDKSTPGVHLAAGSQVDSVAGQASGLVPNALYHLRLVATSSAGTVHSPDATFRTAKDPAPPRPRFGATINVVPASRLVLIRARRLGSSRTSRVARLITGPDFLPLTENRQLPIDSQFDARAGSLRLAAASADGSPTQRAAVAGGVFTLYQTRPGPGPGLTTLSLLEGGFPGGPTYDECPGGPADPASNERARTVRSNSAVLQTLHASDQTGRFATRGSYSISAASAAGAAWDTVDRCDGTLTLVRRGSVAVFDLRLGTRTVLRAGQRYLAQAA
jgi:hypothetical protein